jgi:polyphosphate kinase
MDISSKPKRGRKPKKENFDFVDNGGEFVNRELGWLEFNTRVLNESLDARTPLLERVRFLGIFTSNLDEFFMKRVGGLKRQVLAGIAGRGLTAQQQLSAIRNKVKPMLQTQAQCFLQVITPALESRGVQLLKWKDLDVGERSFTQEFFRNNVFPVLTPLAVDPGHPFPFMSNLSTSLGVSLRHPDRDERLFARIKVPKVFAQWVRVNPTSTDKFRFISLQEIILRHLDQLFPSMELLGVMPFRITRNADIERDEEDAEDLLEMIEEELRERRFGEVIRLEHGPNPDLSILRFLQQELDIKDDDIYELAAELDYTDLKPIADLAMPHLRFEQWTPVVPVALADEQTNIFSVLRGQDLLLHHPYESFTATVERFLKTAAEDPKVLAIKMTMYRIGDNSPFIPHLIRAAEHGKQVVCLVELKARFDEARNIYWAQALEDAGVHVVYGIVGLKTHAKVALVVRQEPEGLRCYVHLGTGNYHAETAKLYTDFGYMTSKRDFTEDVVELFHYLTGRSLKKEYRKLLVAPVNMRDRFIAAIQRETQNKEKGLPARIVAKMNNLEDRLIIDALYEAARKGVKIELIVRGFCTLRTSVPNSNNTIRVISIIGRFLEHSRVFFFANGASDPLQGEMYIGSADWMYRNLQGRVEAVTPIEDLALKERLWEVLQVMLDDRRQAWVMQPDGSYIQLKPEDASQEMGTHQKLMNLTRLRHGLANG